MVKNEKHFDYFLLITVFIISVFGLVILATASIPISQERFGESFYYLKRQIFLGLLPGIFFGFLAYKVKIAFFKKWALFFLLLNILLLSLVFLPFIGIKAGGASRWLNLRFFWLQPAEFLKLSFILYLASWLESRQKREGRNFRQTFIAFLLIITLISFLLISQPDVSTLIIIILTSILLYFLAPTPLWHTFLILVVLIVGGIILTFSAEYRLNRILVFLNPEFDPLGRGYQLRQSLISVGSGKLFGVGIGLSHQKFGLLPAAISDSIFPILAEETGFIGTLFLIFFYLIFFWRGFKIGRETEDLFSKLVAFGITFWITFQSLFNIASMIGILPLTGIPLPFISHGGSALVSALIALGILLNISKNTL